MIIFKTLLTLFSLTPPFCIDGSFKEWNYVNSSNLGIIETKTSESRVAFLTKFQDSISLQNSSVPIILWIDRDHDQKTGDITAPLAGADLKIIFSPSTRYGKKANNGASVQQYIINDNSKNTSYKWKEYKPSIVNLTFAPTTKSNLFEIHLNVENFKSKSNKSSALLTLNEKIINSPITFNIIKGKSSNKIKFDINKLKSNLRVISWNGENGALLKNKSRSKRIIQALNPDIILLQEVKESSSKEDLENFLNNLNIGTWTSSISNSERIVSVTATKLSARSVPEFDNLINDDIKSPVRGSALEIKYMDKILLVSSIHLKCCGGATGREENIRISQSKLLNERFKKASKRIKASGVIIGGDFNLVGTNKPLEILQESSLNATLVNPLLFQPDGVFTATWDRDTSNFTPGRIDFILYSPEIGSLEKSFILDTRDLNDETLLKMNLKEYDTTNASDHLPIAIDLNCKRSSP